MIENYEFTVIFSTAEEKTKAGLELVESTFQKNGVVINKKDDIGVRNLAYLIKKQDRGYYVYYEVSADGATISNMSRVFELDTNILKFLFINPKNN